MRVIAATNRDLEELIEEGSFRQDLYYRLNVFPIHMPPLRERRTDILLLANYFVEKYSKAAGKHVRRISAPAIDMMMSYHWPGNVRELENCIERGVLLTQDDVIHGHHLPPTLHTAESGRPMDGEGAAERAGPRRARDDSRRAEGRPGQHGARGPRAGHHRAHHGPAGEEARHRRPVVSYAQVVHRRSAYANVGSQLHSSPPYPHLLNVVTPAAAIV